MTNNTFLFIERRHWESSQWQKDEDIQRITSEDDFFVVSTELNMKAYEPQVQVYTWD